MHCAIAGRLLSKVDPQSSYLSSAKRFFTDQLCDTVEILMQERFPSRGLDQRPPPDCHVENDTGETEG